MLSVLLFASSALAAAAVTRSSGTLSLADTKGAAGEQCLTFRNNGEIVEAACVTTSVDRQITPATNAAGLPVLLVERSFGAAQAAPLVGVQPCIGFNGTDFLASDCAALSAATAVTLSAAGELVAGTACSTGVDALSQLTVSTTGAACATYASTTVQRSIDNAGTPAPGTAAVAPAAVAATTGRKGTAAAKAAKAGAKKAKAAAGTTVAPPTAAPAAPAAAPNAAVTRTSGTLSLADDNGVQGEQCITFRNNGEIVEAACVTTAIDRQITPGTTAAGLPVLFVERAFGAAQAAPLVGVQPCIGFNGTDFLASDCNKLTADTAVTLSAAGELVAGAGACSTGVDGISQLTVSAAGEGCTTYTGTTVQLATSSRRRGMRRVTRVARITW